MRSAEVSVLDGLRARAPESEGIRRRCAEISPMSSNPNGGANSCGPGLRLFAAADAPAALPGPLRPHLAARALDALPVMAGPFEASDFAKPDSPRQEAAPGMGAVADRAGDARRSTPKAAANCATSACRSAASAAGTLYLGGDGKLWLWDIFNANQNGILPRNVQWDGFGGEQTVDPQNGANYVAPAPISVRRWSRALRCKVDGDMRAPGRARHGRRSRSAASIRSASVHYTDPAVSVAVTLTAYSPFIPLNADDSGLPVTLCELTLTNTTDQPVEAEIGGWLENAVQPLQRAARLRQPRSTRSGRRHGRPCLRPASTRTPPARRRRCPPRHPGGRFRAPTYGPGKWRETPSAPAPSLRTAIPGYQGDVGGEGKRVVNSHASAPGTSIAEKDSRTGKLTSPPFTLERELSDPSTSAAARISTRSVCG